MMLITSTNEFIIFLYISASSLVGGIYSIPSFLADRINTITIIFHNFTIKVSCCLISCRSNVFNKLSVNSNTLFTFLRTSCILLIGVYIGELYFIVSAKLANISNISTSEALFNLSALSRPTLPAYSALCTLASCYARYLSLTAASFSCYSFNLFSSSLFLRASLYLLNC